MESNIDNIAISARHLSKQYRIGAEEEKYDTLGGALLSWLRSPIENYRKLRSLSRFDAIEDQDTVLWAVQDLSFDIKQGEVVGVIGRNGAGKSTLLKLLSRITEPTNGRAEIRGRVSSLLEVGTGFHPELSGRENIYLNGTILGMSRKEVDARFDAIVDFSEIRPFLDTPVKRYSSGMGVRLAFAVAAHLEPEILLVDEVLAVGDTAFQRKCLGRMESYAQGGRTVLFVSHDLTNISVLCERSMLLDRGRLVMFDATDRVIDHYLRGLSGSNQQGKGAHSDSMPVQIDRIELLDGTGKPTESVYLSNAVRIKLRIRVRGGAPQSRLNPVLKVTNPAGVVVFTTANYSDAEWGDRLYTEGVYEALCIVPGHVLNSGQYYLDAMVVRESRQVVATTVQPLTFGIVDDGKTRGGYLGEWKGVVRPDCTWTMEKSA